MPLMERALTDLKTSHKFSGETKKTFMSDFEGKVSI
jgi:hypothetical protein